MIQVNSLQNGAYGCALGSMASELAEPTSSNQPAGLDAMALPGAISASQVSSIADSIVVQRCGIEALKAQLSSFEEQLAVLEGMLGPLAEWSRRWAELELTALSVADAERMQITVLAAQIGWERSRVSHHVRRMSVRGLVTCGLSAADRRVTEVTLTSQGRQGLEEAAPGHVELVRRLFFGGLPVAQARKRAARFESGTARDC